MLGEFHKDFRHREIEKRFSWHGPIGHICRNLDGGCFPVRTISRVGDREPSGFGPEVRETQGCISRGAKRVAYAVSRR